MWKEYLNYTYITLFSLNLNFHKFFYKKFKLSYVIDCISKLCFYYLVDLEYLIVPNYTAVVNFIYFNICVYEDFNTVRCLEERRSVESSDQHVGSAYFNQFIRDNCLLDLPLRGSQVYVVSRGRKFYEPS